jgi:carbon storage regulator
VGYDTLHINRFSNEGNRMLVLTRKMDQSLVIGTNVVVTVLSTEGGRVRLGITAPRHISVRRAELAPLAPQEAADVVATTADSSRRSEPSRERAVLSGA